MKSIFIVVEKLLSTDLFVDDAFISKCVRSLCDHHTIALFGKWGSGKRTLAKHIALDFAKKKGLKIRIIKHLLLLSDSVPSLCSTVLILDNPIKAQYTDRHNADIYDCLLKMRANAEKNKCYQIVVSHCNDIEVTKKLFKDSGRVINKLCPKIFSISSPIKTLTEIAKMKGKNISPKVIRKIAKENKTSSMGSTLTILLFLRIPVYENKEFLDNPITFLLKKLEDIAKSKNKKNREQLELLIGMIFRNQKKINSEVQAIKGQDVSITLKEGTGEEDLTHEFLQSYVEETQDGKSYRLIHDIITRCVLYTALKYDIHRDLVYRNCDPLLFLDCVRYQTRIPGEFYFDDKTLEIEIPPESFNSFEKSLVERNDTKILQNTKWRLLEDQNLEIKRHEAKTNSSNNDTKQTVPCLRIFDDHFGKK